jgi:LmbE family N-acetylglucosaminyl deacetylase
MIFQHVYLSPHYDDAALSCGGAIYQETQAGEPVLVVTICAAAPPSDTLSAYARQLHRQWGNTADIVATRRAEDAQAMACLGAASHYLTLPDCIYRGQATDPVWFYNSDADIFGAVHAADMPLATTIAQSISELTTIATGARFYAPLAVGHHVDHQLTHLAAWQLFNQGQQVVFYEDYPYVDPNYPFTTHGEGNSFDLDKALQAVTQTALRLINPLNLLNLPAGIVAISSSTIPRVLSITPGFVGLMIAVSAETTVKSIITTSM